MAIETIKESLLVSKLIGHEKLTEMVEGDIIVPDIKPDILSVIKVDGNVYVTKKELLEGKVKLEGVVDVYAIYISDNESNAVKGINASLNFTEMIDVPYCNMGMIPIVKHELKSMDCKVLNGRKITVKASVDFDLKVMESSHVSVIKDIPDNANIQLLKKEMKMNSLVGCNAQKVSIKENVNLSEGKLPIGEILKADLKIVDKDFKISYNKILAKAEANVKLIYLSDDEEPAVQIFETTLPVMGFIDLENVNDSMKCEIDYDVLSFYVKPNYQDARATSIYVEADIELNTRAYEERAFELIEDLYHPEKNVDYDSSKVELDQNLVNQNERIEIKQAMNMVELDNSRIFDISCYPNISAQKVLEDKIVMEGNVIADIFYAKNDRNTLETKRVDIPFQQVVSVKGIRAGMKDSIYVEVESAEYNFLSNGQFDVKINLNLQIQVEDTLELNIIDNIMQTDEVLEEKDSIIIYYVKPNDTLWLIAKKYHTTVDDLVAMNELNGDNLMIGQQLMIPRKTHKTIIKSFV